MRGTTKMMTVEKMTSMTTLSGAKTIVSRSTHFLRSLSIQTSHTSTSSSTSMQKLTHTSTSSSTGMQKLTTGTTHYVTHKIDILTSQIIYYKTFNVRSDVTSNPHASTTILDGQHIDEHVQNIKPARVVQVGGQQNYSVSI